jgi:hypothetical protein
MFAPENSHIPEPRLNANRTGCSVREVDTYIVRRNRSKAAGAAIHFNPGGIVFRWSCKMFPQRDPVETQAGTSPAGSTPFVLLSSYRKVRSASRYLVSGAPTRCALCTLPFQRHNELLECWHGADNRYYCSEECSAKRNSRARQPRKAA